MSDQWPAQTPRDEMLARVVTRGRQLRFFRRCLIAGGLAGAAAIGAAGYALGTTGTIDVVAEGTVSAGFAAAPLHACPGGEPIADLHRGDRVFLTGRDDSGDWVELRSPITPDERMWMRSDELAPDADVADLPVQPCGLSEATLTLPDGSTVEVTTTTTTIVDDETTTTTAPGQTTTTQSGQPTVPGTQPPPTPTTAPSTTAPPVTVPPDTTGPTISGLDRTNPDISEDAGEFCIHPLTSEVSAVVTDPSGLQSVVLRWSFVGNGQTRSGSKPMVLSGGRYRATLGPFPSTTLANLEDPNVNWSIRAVDGAGNPRVVGSNVNSAVHLHWC